MKKRYNIFTIFAFLFLSLLFVTCKKEKLRKKYEGDYTFTVHGTYSGVSQPTVDTTYTFEGHIDGIKKHKCDTVFLSIHYKSSSSSVTTSINDNAKLSCTSPVITGNFSDDDHISFTTDDLTQDHCYYEEVTGVRN